MKSKLVFLLICCFAIPVFANDNKDVEEIKDIIQLFVDSGDKQDPALLEECLLSEAKQFMPSKKGITIIDNALYTKLLEAKRIGGSKRSVNIHNVELDENGVNAVAKVELTSEKRIFHQFIGLSKIKATEATVWRIVSVLTSVTPVQK